MPYPDEPVTLQSSNTEMLAYVADVIKEASGPAGGVNTLLTATNALLTTANALQTVGNGYAANTQAAIDNILIDTTAIKAAEQQARGNVTVTGTSLNPGSSISIPAGSKLIVLACPSGATAEFNTGTATLTLLVGSVQSSLELRPPYGYTNPAYTIQASGGKVSVLVYT